MAFRKAQQQHTQDTCLNTVTAVGPRTRAKPVLLRLLSVMSCRDLEIRKCGAGRASLILEGLKSDGGGQGPRPNLTRSARGQTEGSCARDHLSGLPFSVPTARHYPQPASAKSYMSASSSSV